jgi:hypothetical protein
MGANPFVKSSPFISANGRAARRDLAGTLGNDKVGSFLLGLGYSAPTFESAALSVMRFTPQVALDARFGYGGSAMTPLLPLRNRNSATVTALSAVAGSS